MSAVPLSSRLRLLTSSDSMRYPNLPHQTGCDVGKEEWVVGDAERTDILGVTVSNAPLGADLDEL